MSDNGEKPLPIAWVVLALGELRVERSRGIVPSNQPNNYFELYSVPSFNLGKPEIVQGKSIGSNKQIVETDMVLLCKINPRINRVWVVENYSTYPKIASTEWIPFFRSRKLHPKYLCYYMRRDEFRDHLAFQASGVGGSLMRIKASNLADYPIPIPPTAEQARIVAKIEEIFTELDKGIESLKAARAKLNVYRQSVLKHAFEGKLTAQWREENKDKLESPEQLLARIKHERETHYERKLQEWKTTVKKWEESGKPGRKPVRPKKPLEIAHVPQHAVPNLPQLPAGWLWVRLGSISDVTGGLTKNQKRNSLPHKLKYLRVANVYADKVLTDDVHKIGVTDAEAEKVALKAGDLLIVEGNGSIGQIGRVALWEGEIPACGHQNHLIRVRLATKSTPRFFLQFLLSPLGRDLIIKVASSTSGLHTLSISKVSNLIVPAASYAEESAVVVQIQEKLSNIEKALEEVDMQLVKSKSLRQSILRKAFSGQLVAQDPNDEPASALLNRIKAEKTAQSQRNTRAKRRRTAAMR